MADEHARRRCAAAQHLRPAAGARQHQEVGLERAAVLAEQLDGPRRLEAQPVGQRAPAEVDHHRVTVAQQPRQLVQLLAIAHRRRELDDQRHTRREQRASTAQYLELVSLYIDPCQTQVVERMRPAATSSSNVAAGTVTVWPSLPAPGRRSGFDDPVVARR